MSFKTVIITVIIGFLLGFGGSYLARSFAGLVNEIRDLKTDMDLLHDTFSDSVNVCEDYNDKIILMKNKPVLVPDEKGEHVRTYVWEGNKIEMRFRYDPEEAIKQVCD